jgi:flagellar basal-body rod modification protein FlgD
MTLHAAINRPSMGAQGFKPTENPSKDIERAEKHLFDQIKQGQVGKNIPDQKGKLNSQMVLGKMEEWIKLLLASLKNQDPTEPVDHKDMLRDFGVLVQTNGMNNIIESLEQFKNMMGTTHALEAAQQLDKIAKIESDTYYYDRQKPIGLSFDLPPQSQGGTIIISDSYNRMVAMVETNAKEGENHFLWDGKDKEGTPVENGIYKFTVIPLDENNRQIKDMDGMPYQVPTYIVGRIHGSEKTNQGARVKINQYGYPMENLRSLDMIQIQEIPQESQATQASEPEEHREQGQ